MEFGAGDCLAQQQPNEIFVPSTNAALDPSSAASESKEDYDSLHSEQTRGDVKTQFHSPHGYKPQKIFKVEELLNDTSFYSWYDDLVDAFFDAVCQDGATTKGELRDLIAKADARISRDTGEVTAIAGIFDPIVQAFGTRTKDGLLSVMLWPKT